MLYRKLQAGAKQRGCSCPKSRGYEPKSSPRASEPTGFITTSQLKGGLGEETGGGILTPEKASEKHLFKQSATAQNTSSLLF